MTRRAATSCAPPPAPHEVVQRAAAATALVLLSPAMVAIALVLRLVAGPPVLFRQTRAGLHGRPFVILKFRTIDMTGAHCCLHPSACTGVRPDRVTVLPFCAWLRRTGLDELPQLWNIVRGDMNVVGPRPLMVRYTDRYTARQRRRLEVRPGVTGWAQTHGRTDVPWEQRLELDVWYVEHRTAWLDLRTALRTVHTALTGSGSGAADVDLGLEFLGVAATQDGCPVTGRPLDRA